MPNGILPRDSYQKAPMTRWRKAACCILTSASASGALGAQAPAFVEPKWPQPFTLERGDRAAYGIAVGAPGAIVVSVNARGAVIVSIVRPNGTVAKEMPGAGSIRVDYVATKEDVATGMGWRIGVRDAATAPMRGGRFDAASAGAATSGTIGVEHPAGDATKVRITAAAPAPPPGPVRLDAALAEVQAARARARTDAQAQRARMIQVKLPAAARAEPQPLTGRTGMPARSGAATSTTQSASTGTGTTGGGGTVPVGSNPPQTIAANPVIASLDTSAGSPGDVVLITGSGFGPTPGGEVHFMVAAGADLPGTVTYWSDAQITVQVPKKDGVRSFAGQVYVRRGTNNSLLKPFRFEPEMAYAVIPVSTDRQVGDADVATDWRFMHGGWPGIKGDDEFFLHTTLKNGWVLDEAYVTDRNGGVRGPAILSGKGDVYVSVAAIGSDSPRIKVHWWGEVNGFYTVWLYYWPVVVIRGPKGLPWQ